MKRIGLLGGMSWESTATYYQLLNQTVSQKLGGFHSAKILLYSVDFQEIEACQSAGDWDKSAAILLNAAQRLETAGAELVAICTNTMHKVADTVQQGIGIPLVHIADATLRAVQEGGVRSVGLLGTKYTLTEDFLTARIRAAGVTVVLPDDADIDRINDIIYNELCKGVISAASRNFFLSVIDSLTARGAEGIILGCTEIGLLVAQGDTAAPLFDTTAIHARAIAQLAL